MRDPERLSSSNGISSFERELLDAGKKEAMPAALREQMERALGFSGAVMPSAPVHARVEAATGIKASAMLWISAGVVALGVVGGILGARLGSRLFPPHTAAPVTAPPSTAPASAQASPVAAPALALGAPPMADAAPARDGHGAGPSATTARRMVALAGSPVRSHVRASSHTSSGGHHRHNRAATSSAKAAATSSGPAAAAAALPAETAAPATADTAAEPSAPSADVLAPPEPRPSPAKAAPRPEVAAGDLRAEIDLIDGARAALRDGETSRALDLLGDHAMHFPHGSLLPEETALRVEALMRLGRVAEARAYARRFVAANPASPLAERMRRLVKGDLSP